MRSDFTSNKAVGLFASLSGVANAFWRMPCSGRLSLERADPIIDPGKISGHVHTISGGNGFGFSMDYDQARNSSCSSCPIKQDLSNYWTPKLYYINENNTYEDVPQAGEGNGNTGGMTVYYEQRLSKEGQTPLAFPKNFRMVAGDPFQRNYTGEQAAPGNAVSFVCLDYSGKSPQTNAIPNTNCPDGLRAQVYFPSCWNNETDSPDHKSHMAYPIGDNTYDNGHCPPSHPTRLISLFFEVIYDIDQFSDRWYSDKHPFVFAQGDRTGYGFHGDFVNGWDVDYLQDAIDQCNADSGLISDCPVFNTPDTKSQQFTSDEQQACRIPPSIDEEVTGILPSLPGCNTPTDGPEYAPPPATCNVQSKIGLAATYFTDVTKSLDFAYQGCATDDYYTRTFTGASTSSDNMTVESCINFCKGKGYSLAGLEYARECYCDNTYQQTDRAPKQNVMGGCETKCSGDAGEICGGSGALSVYKACDGGACDNSVYKPVGNNTVTDSPSTKAKRHLNQHRHGHLHHS